MPKNNEVKKLRSLIKDVTDRLISDGYISELDSREINKIAQVGGEEIGPSLRIIMPSLEEKDKKDSDLYDLVGKAFYNYMKMGRKNQAKENKYSIDSRTIEVLFELTNHPDEEFVIKALRDRYTSLSHLTIYVGYVGWKGYCKEKPITIKEYLLNKEYQYETMIGYQKDKKTDTQEEHQRQEKKIIEKKAQQKEHRDKVRNFVYLIAALVAIVTGYFGLADELELIFNINTHDERRIVKTSVFKSNDPNTFKLLVLPLKSYSEEKTYSYSEQFKDRFNEIIMRDSLNLEVCLLPDSIILPTNYVESELLTKKYGADMVIWGNVEEACDDPSLACIIYSLSDHLVNDNANIQLRSDTSGYGYVKPRTKFRNGYLQEKIDNIIFWLIAVSHYDKGQYSKCLTSLQKIIKEGECNFNFLLIAGMASSNAGFEEIAMKYFLESINCEVSGDPEFYSDFKELLKFEPNLEKDFKQAKNTSFVLYNIGCLLSRFEKDNEAIIAFKGAIALNPNDEKTLLAIGYYYFKTKDYNKSLKYNRKVLIINPNRESNLLNIALILEIIGRTNDAINIYNNILDINPKNVKALNGLGTIYLKASDSLQNVQEYFNEVLSIDSNNIEALRVIAGLLSDSGEFDDALHICNKILSLEPKDIGIRYLFAKIKERTSTDLELLGIYEKILEIDPENVGALQRKAFYLLKMNDKMGALDCYNDIQEIEPINTDNLLNKAFVYEELDFEEKSLKTLHLLLDINPLHIEAMCNLALLERNIGDTNSSLKTLDKIINIDSSFYQAWHIKAMLLNDLGEYDDAMLAIKKATELNHIDFQSFCIMGEWLLESENFEESIIAFKSAIYIDSSSFRIWSNLGRALSHLGKSEEAIDVYKKALVNIDFADSEILKLNTGAFLENREAHLWNQLSIAYADNCNYIEALKASDKALCLINEDTTYWNNNTSIKCENIIHSSRKKYPLTYDIWVNKGDIYYNNDETKKSIDAYKNALQIDLYPTCIFHKTIKMMIRNNQEEDAVNLCINCIEIDPNYVHAYIELSMLKLLSYDSKDALIYVNKAIKIDPNYHEALFIKGLVLYKLERNMEALTQFKLFAVQEPEYYDNWMEIGNIELGFGNYKEAIKNYKICLDLSNCSQEFFDSFDYDFKYIKPHGISQDEYQKIKEELQKYCEEKK